MKNHRNLEWCKGKNVDLVKSFPDEYLLAKFGFDTAKNEPPKGPKNVCRTPLVIDPAVISVRGAFYFATPASIMTHELNAPSDSTSP